LSGLDFPDGRSYRKGASDAVCAYIGERGARIPEATQRLVDDIARQGRTPIVVAEDKNILGVVALSDVLKPGIRDRFERLRAMGLRVVIVTGDNPLTAAAIAEEAAIIPAMFMLAIPQLEAINIMRLATPGSAILSALIFNAIIIPLLIPIAIKGVKYRPMGADNILRRNLLVYGLGGIITPFAGIKLIDLALSITGLF